jgi:hypothetical protein
LSFDFASNLEDEEDVVFPLLLGTCKKTKKKERNLVNQ